MGRLLLLLFAALPLFASDISGIWVGRLNNQDIAFQFTQKGDTLGGKLYGDYRSMPVVEGKLSGDTFTFVVVTEEQDGNQINQTRLFYTGSLKGEKLEMTSQREGSTNAGNSGGVQSRRGVKQTFTLKRLL